MIKMNTALGEISGKGKITRKDGTVEEFEFKQVVQPQQTETDVTQDLNKNKEE